MNKKILISTLVLFLIISIGSVYANEDIADNSILQNADGADNAITETTTSENVVKTTKKDNEPLRDSPIEIADGETNENIQNALNGLKDNDVVNFAKNGNYNNIKLIITNQTPNTRLKNITLNGNGATLKGTLKTNVNSSYYDGLFEIQNVDGFTLSGFNFIAEGVTVATMKTPSCVIIYNTKDGIIENNNISGGRFGLYVGSKFNAPNNDTIVRNNTITNVTDGGIISFGSARSLIVNNTIINPVNHGIDVRHGSGPNCIVQGNKIIGAREAIYLMHSQGHKAINNTIYNSDVGITCYGSSNIFCDNNTFLDNTKIGFLLASGYKNITIGKNNNYDGLAFIPMPPTFKYNIVKADGAYVGQTNGVFNQQQESCIEANDITTDIKTSTVLNATFKDANDKTVANKIIKVSVNGVESNVTTDANGVAKIDVNHETAGTYCYDLVFLGDEDYKASFKTVKVTVNGPATPSINGSTTSNTTNQSTPSTVTPVKTVKQVTKASMSAKRYKAKAKNKKVTFTLKTKSGKALKNKYIEFKIGKKTYIAKTNAKGIATVKVKLTKKGKYTVTAKFIGDDAYKAVTKKTKLTITK